MIHGNARHNASQCGPAVEGGNIQSRHRDQYIGISRSATAALGEHHNGQVVLFGEAQQSIDLTVMKIALRSRQHRVVINNQGGLALYAGKQVTIHRANGRNDGISCSIGIECCAVASTPLRGDRQLPVFAHGAAVSQINQIFPSGAPASLTPLGHRLGSSGVHRIGQLLVENLIGVFGVITHGYMGS